MRWCTVLEKVNNIFGLWSLDLMEKLESDLLKGQRKVEVWADSIGVKIVNIDYKKPDPFFNINTEAVSYTHLTLPTKA